MGNQDGQHLVLCEIPAGDAVHVHRQKPVPLPLRAVWEAELPATHGKRPVMAVDSVMARPLVTAVIGDQRKYVTAIIIPAYEALKEYAAQKQIQYRNLEELVKNQSIQKLIQERISELQANFARFEQIKRFTLLPRAFSMETGELTNTLKIRRPVINQLYRAEIEAMYM